MSGVANFHTCILVGILLQGCVHVYNVFLLLDFSGDHQVEEGGGGFEEKEKERDQRLVRKGESVK